MVKIRRRIHIEWIDQEQARLTTAIYQRVIDLVHTDFVCAVTLKPLIAVPDTGFYIARFNYDDGLMWEVNAKQSVGRMWENIGAFNRYGLLKDNGFCFDQTNDAREHTFSVVLEE